MPEMPICCLCLTCRCCCESNGISAPLQHAELNKSGELWRRNVPVSAHWAEMLCEHFSCADKHASSLTSRHATSADDLWWHLTLPQSVLDDSVSPPDVLYSSELPMKAVQSILFMWKIRRPFFWEFVQVVIWLLVKWQLERWRGGVSWPPLLEAVRAA